MKSLLLVVMGAALANNYALTKFLGISPVIGFSRKNNEAEAMGIAVAIVLLVSTAICYPVGTALAAEGYEYLSTFAFVAIILAIVYLLGAVIKKPLGVFFPLIALNSAVLGLAENGADSFALAICEAVGAALGFMLALFVMQGLQRKINDRYVPKAFRGLPAAILAAGIVSMALMAF